MFESNSAETHSPRQDDEERSKSQPGTGATASPAVLEAGRYFEVDGEYLIPRVKDYKGKTWADQQRRFILLYSWAYQLLMNTALPLPVKEHLENAAKKAAIYDGNNFAKYVAEALSSVLNAKSTGATINIDGEKKVQNYLREMADDALPSGFDYSDKRTKPSAKRSRIGADDKARVLEWVQETVDLGGIDIIKVEKALDYVLLSLWIITVHLHKVDSVQWNEAYLYLSKKFGNISVPAKSFGAAVRNPAHGKYLRTSQSGGFFLSDEGRQKVEAWVAGQAINAE